MMGPAGRAGTVTLDWVGGSMPELTRSLTVLGGADDEYVILSVGDAGPGERLGGVDPALAVDGVGQRGLTGSCREGDGLVAGPSAIDLA